MVLVRRADEVVVGRVHFVPDFLNHAGSLVYVFLRCNSRVVSLQLYLLSVLVCAGAEKYIVAALSLLYLAIASVAMISYVFPK